jgi:tRNA pseudouridine55 synthase
VSITTPNTTLEGIVVVDKPEGWTSHDVVARMRRIAGTRRTGHLGTLDPIATGVLPVMIGQTTRLAQFFEKSEKAYEAVVRLGFATTTYDRAGEPCGAITEPRFTREEIESALAPMRGEFDQQPPPVSAKKINGVPAYRLVRQNAPVDLAPVHVCVYELTLVSLEEPLSPQHPRAQLRVRCSPGTYVRSIAHDLGTRLGCGAHIESLRRTASGPFRIDSARTIAELEELAGAGRLAEALLPAAELLPEFPAVFVDDITSSRIRQGRDFAVSPFRASDHQEHVKAIGPDGRLVAIGQIVVPNQYHPITVFS